MRSNTIFPTLLLFVLLFSISCDQRDTRFYEDPTSNGLSIFSTKSNNISSAYFNGDVWRTRDRVYSIFSPTSYEIYIRKEVTTTASDTLTFEWVGYYPGENDQQRISFYFSMAIPKNFRAADLASLKGQRLVADGVNSYFGVRGNSSLPTGKGTGSIYFHMVEIILRVQADGNGRMAGLFEADFPNLNVTKGRFDHNLDPTNVFLP